MIHGGEGEVFRAPGVVGGCCRGRDVHECESRAQEELLRVRPPVSAGMCRDLRFGEVEFREQRRFLAIPRRIVLVPVALH